MKKFKPSAGQQHIYDWVKDGEGSGIVNAVAGSGKTYTIVTACDLIPKEQDCVFLAFNKAIAVELAKKVPDHVEAKTLNSLGHRAWTSHAGRVQLDDKKTYNLCKEHLIGHEQRLRGEVCKLVGLAKSFGIAPDVRNRPNPYKGLMGNGYDDYLQLIEHFDIDVKLTDENTLITLAQYIVLKSADLYRLIDYDDQLWMPVISDIPVKRYDWVIIDEAQDLSPVQRKLVSMSLKDNGRLLAVGDPYQAIYGFRGAASDSMDQLKNQFSCVEMPLSISYRCSKQVVAKAQEVVPHIEAAPDAEEGLVQYMNTQQYSYKVGDMVICRNAAPLVGLAYELLARRVPVLMMGRDIGEGLIKLIDRLKPKGIDGTNGLRVKLELWSAKEIKAAIKKEQDHKIQSIEDKRDSILAFLDGCLASTIPTLKAEIQDLFKPGDSVMRVVLSTVHKAKGLESERVFVYRTDLMPSKWAKLDWMQQQEQNIIYVAYTRAMLELYLVEEREDGEETKTEDKDQSGQSLAATVCDGAETVGGPATEGSGDGRTRKRENVG